MVQLENRRKFTSSLKFKLASKIILLVIGVCCVLGFASYYISSNTLNESVNSKLSQKSDDISKYISSYMENKKNTIQGIANLPDITGMDWNVQKNVLVNENKKLAFDKLAVVDLNSVARSTVNDNTTDLSKVSYVQNCLKGQEGFSDPKISAVNGKLIMDIYVPIKDSNGTVKGALLATFAISKLNDILQQLKFDNSEYAFVVNKEGTVILHQDTNYVKKQFNAVKNAEKDAGYKQLADCVNGMISGETAVRNYKLNGKDSIISYTPVSGVNWYVAVNADKAVLYSGLNSLKTFEIIFLLICIVIGDAVGLIISSRVSKPILKIKELANRFSVYDFSKKIDFSKEAAEYADMGSALNISQHNIKDLVKTISENSEDLSASSEELSASSEELFSRFENVNTSTQNIVSGAQEISASTEEVTASVEEIDANVKNLSNKASEGSSTSKEIKKRALDIQENVKKVIDESRNIYKDKEDKIMQAIEAAKVVDEVKTMADAIASIAEQTNLLALNAAIEAARAGEQGKGFAVVAEEVRKLSEESAQTVSTIQDTIPKIQESFKNLSQSGKELLTYIDEDVNKQYDSYLSTGEQYYKDAEYVDGMSSELLSMTEQISVSIDQVSQVVQNVTENSQKASENTDQINNSMKDATVGMEQIAKTTQGQAELAQKLSEVVQKFKI